MGMLDREFERESNTLRGAARGLYNYLFGEKEIKIKMKANVMKGRRR